MRWLLLHVFGGNVLRHPLRALVQVGAIALGVALGYAVHLINTSALAEFSAAVRQVTGQADASVVGPREGFDEAVFERVANDPQVVLASPLLEVDVAILEPARLRGRSLTITGVDALRSGRLGAAWLGEVDKAAAQTSGRETRFALFDDGMFLSPAALTQWQLAPGEQLVVQVGARTQSLTIVGRLPGAREGSIAAAMDLGFAQWRLDRLGRLTRIDLQLRGSAEARSLAAAWQLPAGVFVERADETGTRVSNLSRAYRINLNVLALVALFTGAFLVYSLQAQGVAARRTQLAFLRVLGLTRGEVERLLLAEAALYGALGALLGLLLGAVLAATALRVLGGDLGSGAFGGTHPALALDPLHAFAFLTLGVLAALFGGWQPARDAARDVPAQALKAGSGLDVSVQRSAAWPTLLLLALALALLFVPPLFGLPLAAYVAIGLLLVAAILAKPLVAPRLLEPLARLWRNAPAPRWLAATRLAATPRFAAIGAAGIVASFALMVAMATMVTSFRASVDDWLARVLPADLYVRAAPATSGSASSARFSAADLQRMAAHPGVARVETMRHVRLVLDAARASITLIARHIDRADPARTLPLTGARAAVPAGMPAVYVSEALVDLYGARPGTTLQLPLGGRTVEVAVAGVWRDYARQFGSVVMDIADYERITGDTARTDASLWLRDGVRAADVARDLAGQLDARSAEFAEPGEIRAVSLRIFDRSFAVTYLLELAAIIIGLTGIAATFAAQAIVRTKEFGMLRHLGVTRRDVLRMLAYEGLLITAMALVIGLAAGLAIAWVLVAIVNPQSFHWSMDLRLPVPLIATLSVALLVAAALTAAIAGRQATARSAVLAVREDF